MPVWLWILDFLAAIVGALLIPIIAFAMRRRLLVRSGGTFDISINLRTDHQPTGWTIGVGRYSENHLEWFRVFSLSPRARYRFERGSFHVHRRRQPEGREVFALHTGHIVVDCDSEFGVRQLALSPHALTALRSWLESSPPGQGVNNVV
ncbi:MAG: DUF2550 domain-containing protein [Propionibacteriales bacterium]|nr:DUF2550 domain-containing protein [Propionibacteriales bacterium]